MSRTTAPRSAFTLVELLVVIAIIGILAALGTAAVQNVRKKGKELECRNDLTSLDTAIGAFRAKMANSPIPSGGGGTNGTFRLCTDYPSPATDSWPEVQALMRMFPRMDRTDNGLRAAGSTTTKIANGQPVLLDGNQCMVFFLSGGRFTEYNGFASDPFVPFAPTATNAKRLSNGAFFEFPQSRMKSPQSYRNPENTAYTGTRFSGDAAGRGNDEPWFCDPWGNPYLYWSTSNSNDYATAKVEIGPWGGQYSFRGAGVGPTPFKESTTKFLNPKTHQIISMGDDGRLGLGDVYTPENGPEYGRGAVGGDDFANFRKSRLGASE